MSLTAQLIEAGLCIDQNFPVLKLSGESAVVNFGNADDLSITLRNVPYAEAYSTLRQSRAFNMCLIDGAMIQALYTFDNSCISRHRLAFFPSPDLLEYQNNSEVYEDDELYGDVIARNVVTVPIRFDFDPSAAVDYDHPSSHMTIGQYKNCRIPVSGAITPCYFMNFILRAFYNTPFRSFCGGLQQPSFSFDETITYSEKLHMHLQISRAS